MIRHLLKFVLITSLPLFASAMPSAYEQDIMAAALVLEAADQGESGMEAILHVFITRAGGNYDRVIGKMVTHGALSSLRSVTAQRHPDYSPLLRRAMRDHRAWNQATRVVDRFMTRDLGPDPTGGADHYDCGTPWWSRSMTLTAVIGDHNFFRSG